MNPANDSTENFDQEKVFEHFIANPYEFISALSSGESSARSSRSSDQQRKIDAEQFLSFIQHNPNKIATLVQKDTDEGTRFYDMTAPAANVAERCQNRLVRVPGLLVQDLLEREFYNGVVEEVCCTSDSPDSEVSRRTIHAKYLDRIECSSACNYIDFDSSACRIFERQPLVCVPVPGESPWVNSNVELTPDSSSISLAGSKRTRAEAAAREAADAAPRSAPTKLIVKLYPNVDDVVVVERGVEGGAACSAHSGHVDAAVAYENTRLLDMVDVIGIYTTEGYAAGHDKSSGKGGASAARDADMVRKAPRHDPEVNSGTLMPCGESSDENTAAAAQHCEGAANDTQNNSQPIPVLHCLMCRRVSSARFDSNTPTTTSTAAAAASSSPSLTWGDVASTRAAVLDHIANSLARVVDTSQWVCAAGQGQPASAPGRQDLLFLSEFVLLALLSSNSAALSSRFSGNTARAEEDGTDEDRLLVGCMPLNLFFGNGDSTTSSRFVDIAHSMLQQLLPRVLPVVRVGNALLNGSGTVTEAGAVNNSLPAQTFYNYRYADSSSEANVATFGADVEVAGLGGCGWDEELAECGWSSAATGGVAPPPSCAVTIDPTNSMTASPLQCGEGTLCIIDETGMNAGTLTKQGVLNLLALQEYCNLQCLQVKYNVPMSAGEGIAAVKTPASGTSAAQSASVSATAAAIDGDTIKVPISSPVIVVSASRSIVLKAHHLQVWVPQPRIEVDGGAAVPSELPPAEFLRQARVYLTNARGMNDHSGRWISSAAGSSTEWASIGMDDDVGAAVESYFVEFQRQQQARRQHRAAASRCSGSPIAMTTAATQKSEDDLSTASMFTLHNWLTMCRLVAISHGDLKVSLRHWERVRQLDEWRRRQLDRCSAARIDGQTSAAASSAIAGTVSSSPAAVVSAVSAPADLQPMEPAAE